ncbi:MAG: hypothetical protein NO515_03215, partial [Candidatus Methanomethylicia archaeon]|nr:hypothetical protein [Candidatus Methanomethylicia archaeon]
KEYIDRLRSAECQGNATESRKRIDEVNVDYFSNLIKELKETTRTSGIHIMTIGYESIVGKIADVVLG